MKATYRGKHLDDMTREELCEALMQMNDLLHLQQKTHLEDIRCCYHLRPSQPDLTDKVIGGIMALILVGLATLLFSDVINLFS